MSADADERDKNQPPCVGAWTFDASRLQHQPGAREAVEPGPGYDIWFSEASVPIPMPDVTGDHLAFTPFYELEFTPFLNLGGSFPHSIYEASGPPAGLHFRFDPPLIDFAAPTTPEEIERANQRVANGGRSLDDDTNGDPDKELTEEHPLVSRPPPVPSPTVQAVNDLLGPPSLAPKEFIVPQPQPPAPNEPSRVGSILTALFAFLFVMAAAGAGLWWQKQRTVDQPEAVAVVSAPKEAATPQKVPTEVVATPTPVPVESVVVAKPPAAAPTPEPVAVITPPPTPPVATPAPVTTATPEPPKATSTTTKPTSRTNPTSVLVSGVGAKPLCKADCTWGNTEGMPRSVDGDRKMVVCGEATYSAIVAKSTDPAHNRCWTATELQPYSPDPDK